MKSNPAKVSDRLSNASSKGVSLSKLAKERDVSNEEMQSLLLKLKELVPNMPKNRKLSKLEIIQYVIDYILDLQIALESHPAASARSTQNSANPNLANGGSVRQPLGVLSPSGNSVVNTCAAQEATHNLDKATSHLSELVTLVQPSRPVSC